MPRRSDISSSRDCVALHFRLKSSNCEFPISILRAIPMRPHYNIIALLPRAATIKRLQVTAHKAIPSYNSAAMQADNLNPTPQPVALSAKVESLRQEIQQLVTQGIESPVYELTRACSLASGDRKSQVDFAKTIQGLANALPPLDRFYVVGADQLERKFCSLDNHREFDRANLRQILEKYIEPLPNFESYLLKTDDQVSFVAVVVDSEQHRPIVVKTDTQDSNGRTYLLQKGDIWIKKQTALSRANRHDIVEMIQTQVRADAEHRAQQRFGDLRDGLEASIRLQSSTQQRIPSEDLVFGRDAEYQAYIEQLLAGQDELRFRMLLTTLRDLLIEKWHTLGAYEMGAAYSIPNFEETVGAHLQSVFQPAARRLLYAGLLLIKHDLCANWFGLLADLLVATFAACERLAALRRPGVPLAAGGTAAIEILMSARVLATYAIRNQKYAYLSDLLHNRWVKPITSRRSPKREPLLFWPLSAQVVGHDRIAFAWNQHVQPFWLSFFGSEESLVDSACQLELVLNLNSYLATQVPEAKEWLDKWRSDYDFEYWYTSDLWRYRLDRIVSLAEKLYEYLEAGPDHPFLLNFSIEQGVFQKGLSTPSQFIQYLQKLNDWQGEACISSQRFPPDRPEWGQILRQPQREAGVT